MWGTVIVIEIAVEVALVSFVIWYWRRRVRVHITAIIKANEVYTEKMETLGGDSE